MNAPVSSRVNKARGLDVGFWIREMAKYARRTMARGAMSVDLAAAMAAARRARMKAFRKRDDVGDRSRPEQGEHQGGGNHETGDVHVVLENHQHQEEDHRDAEAGKLEEDEEVGGDAEEEDEAQT